MAWFVQCLLWCFLSVRITFWTPVPGIIRFVPGYVDEIPDFLSGNIVQFHHLHRLIAVGTSCRLLGILLASTSFVLLHLLIARLTGVALLAGILPACLLGILYVWTGSIFLVGAMHATLNLAPRLLGTWPSDISLLIVHSLALAITVILYLRFGKVARARMANNAKHECSETE